MIDTITIEPAHNGAVLKIGEVKTVWRFEEDDLPGLVGLFHELLEYVHPGHPRDAQRVVVHLAHGAKYECPGCPICTPQDDPLHEV